MRYQNVHKFCNSKTSSNYFSILLCSHLSPALIVESLNPPSTSLVLCCNVCVANSRRYCHRHIRKMNAFIPIAFMAICHIHESYNYTIGSFATSWVFISFYTIEKKIVSSFIFTHKYRCYPHSVVLVRTCRV